MADRYAQSTCLMLVVATVMACSSAKPPPQKPAEVVVTAAPEPTIAAAPAPAPSPEPQLALPSGATWSGVYYSVLFGHLHLIQDGETVKGRWLRPRKDRWGELSGNAAGARLDFKWTEHAGAGAASGKGHFDYRRPTGENVDDVLEGELSIPGQSPTAWTAVKQRNVKPDLEASWEEGEEVDGGDWDR